MKSIDELIQYIEDELLDWKLVKDAKLACEIILEKAKSLKDNESKNGPVQLHCQSCGSLWWFDRRSLQARGILSFNHCDNCPDEPLF